MAKIKKSVSILLAIIMIVSVFTILPVSVSAEDGKVYLAFTSDVHSKLDYLSTWLNAVKSKYDLEHVVYCGDYADHNYTKESDYVNDYLSVVNTTDSIIGEGKGIYTSGNHEYQFSQSTTIVSRLTGLTRIGKPANVSDDAGYIVYCFGASGWYEGKGGFDDTLDIAPLEAFLQSAPTDVPIFIASHFPLHYYNNKSLGERKVTNAVSVIDTLNNYADTHNIFFLWGHNHSKADPLYGKIIGKGGTYDTIQYTDSTNDTRKIKFTYLAAGGMRNEASSNETNYSGLVTTVDKTNQNLTFQYYRRSTGAEIGEPVTISYGGSPVETGEFVYELYPSTNSAVADGEYLIVNSNANGSAYALGLDNGSAMKATAVTIEDIENVKTISLDSVSDASDLVWDISTYCTGYSLYNQGKFLEYSSGVSIAPATTARKYWSYSTSNSRMSINSGGSNRYIYYSNNNFTMGNTTNSVYLFKKKEVFSEPDEGTYWVTASAGEGGSITPSGKVVGTVGEDKTFTFAPSDGYELDKVTVDGEEVQASGSYTFTNLSEKSKHTIDVSFKPITYTVTAAVSGEGGTITPASATVNWGGSQTFTITPASGYAIDKLTDNGTEKTVSNNAYTVSKVKETHAVVVTFKTVPTTTFELANSFEVGKEYLIVSRNTDGSGYMLKNNNNNVAAQEVTVSNKSVTLADTELSGVVWTSAASGSEYDLKNNSRYLKRSSGTLSISTSTSNHWTLDSTGYIKSGNYRLRYNNGFSLSSNASTNLAYLYKKSEITYTITASVAADGSVSPASISVGEGGSATFTVTPVDDLHKVDTVSGTADGETVTISGNEVTVSNIHSSHGISISIKEIEAETPGEGTHYKLVDGFTHGKEYLIVSTKATGAGKAVTNPGGVTSDGSEVTATDITVRYGDADNDGTNDRFITLNPANTAITWTANALTEGFNLINNDTDYLGLSGTPKFKAYLGQHNEGTYWYYTAASNLLQFHYVSGTTTGEYLATNSTGGGFTALKTASGNETDQLYLFEKVEEPVATYTVTWKNGDAVIETDENVPEGTAPEFNGTEPAKTATAQYTYTFSGWSDGTNTYGLNDELPAVTGDVTYTAQFTESLNKYTISFVDDDGTTELASVQVEYGETPLYPGQTLPTKAADADNTYVFTGWTPQITSVTDDATYMAVYEATPRVCGHSISLNGDIALNYYLSLTDEEIENGVTVAFDWEVNGTAKHKELLLQDKACLTDDGYKVSCPVAVAEMTYEITMTVTFGNYSTTDNYSVATYARKILESDYKTKYLNDGYSEDDYSKLEQLVLTMLDYGAKAQLHFDRRKDDLANAGITYTMQAIDDVDAITTGADKMSTDLDAYGLEYTGSTIVYLSETSMRHYYRIVNQEKFDAVKDNITFGGNEPIGYTRKNGQIFFEKKNIAAAELDSLYTFSIGSSTYQYSAIEYVKSCLKSSSISDTMKNLATATYWYNEAANAYFG